MRIVHEDSQVTVHHGSYFFLPPPVHSSEPHVLSGSSVADAPQVYAPFLRRLSTESPPKDLVLRRSPGGGHRILLGAPGLPCHVMAMTGQLLCLEPEAKENGTSFHLAPAQQAYSAAYPDYAAFWITHGNARCQAGPGLGLGMGPVIEGVVETRGIQLYLRKEGLCRPPGCKAEYLVCPRGHVCRVKCICDGMRYGPTCQHSWQPRLMMTMDYIVIFLLLLALCFVIAVA